MTFEATIREFDLHFRDTVQDMPPGGKEWGEKYSACLLDLRITPPSLDGWLPAASVPKK